MNLEDLLVMFYPITKLLELRFLVINFSFCIYIILHEKFSLVLVLKLQLLEYERFYKLNSFYFVLIFQYEGHVLDMFLTTTQRNYMNTLKKLGNKKPQKTIKRPKVQIEITHF